ncbi:HNH endonuclease domain protein [Acetobacteraceae bacterium AT-5844]|nr:HNH endonuclease domain protein [Acetobacteraceae bacterium AT-5844]
MAFGMKQPHRQRAKLSMAKPRIATLDLRTARPAPKVAASHYTRPEHRQWRAEVIRRAGGRCQGCGRGNTRLFADHIVELKDGGAPLALSNGQALCGSCHSAKTARSRAARLATPTPAPPEP